MSDPKKCKLCGADKDTSKSKCKYCGTLARKSKVICHNSISRKKAMVMELARSLFPRTTFTVDLRTWGISIYHVRVKTVYKEVGFFRKKQVPEKTTSRFEAVSVSAKDNEIFYDTKWGDCIVESHHKSYNEKAKALAEGLSRFTKVEVVLA